MNSQQPLPVFLTPRQVGDILRITEQTLGKWRDVGFGPPYRRLGRGSHQKTVYELQALGTWLKQYAYRGQERST